MRFLLIGGFGFIGKHLIKRLSLHGIEFTVVSRRDPESAWKAYPYLLDNTIKETELKQLAETHDVVVHMASSSMPSTGSYLRELTDNVEPTVGMIDRLTYLNPNMKVIFLSSGGQIYGNEYLRPISEEDICCPVSPYGYGKLMIEKSLEYLARTRGVRVAVLRVANPVGRWQVGLRQGIVNVVLQCIKSAEPLTIFGTGEETRDYIDADELSQLIIDMSKRKFEFDAWNVGSGVGTPTKYIVNKIECIMDCEVKKNFLPRRKIDPVSAVLNCNKLDLFLGWIPSRSIDKVIEETISFKLDDFKKCSGLMVPDTLIRDN